MTTSTETNTEPDVNLGAPVGDKAAYLESQKQTLPNFTKTIDSTDLNVGSTINSEDGLNSKHGYGNGDDLPGQVFAPWQLPNPDAAIKAGLPAVIVPEHLILDASDAATHLQGPDALDHVTHELREKLGYPMLATSVGVVNDGPVDTKGSGLPVAEVQVENPNKSE